VLDLQRICILHTCAVNTRFVYSASLSIILTLRCLSGLVVLVQEPVTGAL
jgi:hypothetical protein